jgi:mannose-6-phosphate isomerase-like protein (cupin superfamily)
MPILRHVLSGSPAEFEPDLLSAGSIWKWSSQRENQRVRFGGRLAVPMSKVVNINSCFDQFDDTFSPKIIGELNGQLVMAVRCEGDRIPWHTHDAEDEMFLVLKGALEIHERGKQLSVGPGEFYIVRRGVEHRILPRGPVEMLLFEPAGIQHTGKVVSEVTKKEFDRLDT